MEISDRLRQARIDAGFPSAAIAADRLGWKGSTYAAHENGTRGVKTADIVRYAKAFRSDPCYIAFGVERKSAPIAGVPERVLREVTTLVLSQDGAKTAPPSEITDLIIDLCRHVNQSGEGGLAQIVDFQMARRAAQSA